MATGSSAEQTAGADPKLAAGFAGLAELLPERAWLTKITWQQETLELTGNTLSFAALKALEAQLRQLPLFKLGSPGETQQDAQGRWQFHYRLMRSGAHENAL